RKQYSTEDRRRLILGILNFLQVANAKHENVQRALERNDFPDFEDCLQDECALENHADYIITRNTDDFSSSSVPALTPTDFLQKHSLN
ncbi:MAG: PIN domain-containing protein, partial [Lachnoclostridium sp.]|nr:PIN domain-containing protein [Lachnoclostridium sp.]